MAGSLNALQSGTNAVNIDALAVKVQNLEGGIQDVRSSIAQQGREFSAALSLQSDRLTSAIDAIRGGMEKRSEIPWPALSIILAVVVTVGTLAYWPVRENQNDFKESLKMVSEAQVNLTDTLRTNYASREELDWRSQRSKEDRERTEIAIRDLRESVFPREVHLQRWARFDGDIAGVRHDVDLQVQNLQRQIEQIQKSQGDTYTARDQILENRDQIRRLEEQYRQLLERKYQ